MLSFIAVSLQTAYASTFGPALAPNILAPDSTVPKWYNVGLAAQTHCLLWNGPAEAQPHGSTPVAFNLRGPATTTVAGYYPSEIQAAYGVSGLGGSKAIAIVDAYHFSTALSDFNGFSAQFGLPQESSTSATSSTNAHFQVVYEGTAAPAVNSSWNIEEGLDIEWAHAMAPNAKIYLVEANSSSFSDLFSAVQKAGSLPNVAEVSMSFGGSEFSTEMFEDGIFTAKNVVYFASTGDSKGIKEYPSESPNVVAVGGTTLKMSGSKVTSETAWSSGGGGTSSYEALPTYQSTLSPFIGTHRSAADISAVADPTTGAAVLVAGKWYVVGGTSLSSPIVAGLTNAAASFLGTSKLELAKIYAGLGSANFRACSSGTSATVNKATSTTLWNWATGVGSPLGSKGL